MSQLIPKCQSELVEDLIITLQQDQCDIKYLFVKETIY
jgi:hypothetical protein